MHVAIPNVVPHPLRSKFDGVGMVRLLGVVEGVSLVVPAAADVAANQTHPEGVRLTAHHALVGHIPLIRISESAHRAAGVDPPREAVAVKGVVAREGKHPGGGRVHSVEADGTGGQLNESIVNRQGLELISALELHALHKQDIADVGLASTGGGSVSQSDSNSSSLPP